MTDTTRESVERFGPYAVDGVFGAYGEMKVDDFGGWVRFEDYIAVLIRAEAAEANGEKWRSMWEKEQSHNEELRAERDELQAKLALAVEAMAGFASWDQCWPGNVNLEAECRKIRATLAQLTADTPNGADEDNRRAEMEEAQHQEEMRRMEEREMEDHFRRHPHG